MFEFMVLAKGMLKHFNHLEDADEYAKKFAKKGTDAEVYGKHLRDTLYKSEVTYYAGTDYAVNAFERFTLNVAENGKDYIVFDTWTDKERRN